MARSIENARMHALSLGFDTMVREKRAHSHAIGKPWPVYDSPWTNYGETFYPTLPDASYYVSWADRRDQFYGYIKSLHQAAAQDQESPNPHFLGVDLMGSGSQLFRTLPEQLFTKSLGVTLLDFRTLKEKQLDSDANHTVLAQNIHAPTCIPAIDTWRKDNPLHMVLMRPVGGVENVSPNPFLQFELLSALYARLAPHGVLFTEVPGPSKRYLFPWLEMMRDVPGVELQLSKTELELRLEKKGDQAPEQLPSLSPRTVLAIMNNRRYKQFG